jgi:hypothetical protein
VDRDCHVIHESSKKRFNAEKPTCKPRGGPRNGSGGKTSPGMGGDCSSSNTAQTGSHFANNSSRLGGNGRPKSKREKAFEESRSRRSAGRSFPRFSPMATIIALTRGGSEAATASRRHSDRLPRRNKVWVVSWADSTLPESLPTRCARSHRRRAVPPRLERTLAEVWTGAAPRQDAADRIWATGELPGHGVVVEVATRLASTSTKRCEIPHPKSKASTREREGTMQDCFDDPKRPAR